MLPELLLYAKCKSALISQTCGKSFCYIVLWAKKSENIHPGLIMMLPFCGLSAASLKPSLQQGICTTLLFIKVNKLVIAS